MVADEASLLEGVGRLKPAIVIIDMSLSSGNVQDLIANVTRLAPNSKVLMLSVHDEPSVVEAALNAGADALILKRCLATDLLSAVDALRAGKRYLSPELSSR